VGQSVYGELFEDVPENAPTPVGRPVRQSTTFDANLEHCKVTGCSAMGGVFQVQDKIVLPTNDRGNSYLCK
jgi:hypothetical protein